MKVNPTAGSKKGPATYPLPVIDRLPDDIKAALTEKVLTQGERYEAITQWLHAAHGVKISKTSVGRFGKDTRVKFGALVKLGMPIKEIVKHRLLIDAVGTEQVKQQLIDKLAEKTGSLFAYLDETEADQ